MPPLSAAACGERIRVWPENNTNGTAIALPKTWSVGSGTIPPTLYVQGVETSAAPRDVALELRLASGGVTCCDTVRVTVVKVEIEFVHAEGENEGEPMTHLPVFTPSDGTGKGEPVYDCPDVDLSVAFSPTNAAGLRAAALLYLGNLYAVTETAPDSLVFTNGAASLAVSGALLDDTNVLEYIAASVTVPALGITNAVYPCVETSAESSAFGNVLYGVVFTVGAPSGVPRAAVLHIGTEAFSDDAELAETSAGSNLFEGGGRSVRLLEITGLPRLAVSDGALLTNAVFSVWETAPQSGVYRNYNEPVPTDLPASALAVPDFAPWRLRIKGITDPSLISQVTVTTSVDSVSHIAFTAVGGSLLSDQKFILIPGGGLEADPPGGYTPLRVDTEHLRWKNPTAHSVSAIAFLTGCTPVKKAVPPEKDALVWRSLDKKTSSGAGLDESAKVATPLGDMKYYALPHNNADRGWVLENIKKKGIWYSMCHSRLVTGLLPDKKVKFIGLKFKAGDLITQADLAGLNLDYKLVMVDGCCSAMTERLDEFDVRLNGIPGFVQSNPSAQTKASARNNNSIVDECVAFADAFGEDSAYMGWAWIMNVTVAQNWTSDFLNNLKGGKTVQQAHEKFLSDNNALEPTSNRDERLMKIYGAIDNVIDKTPNTDNAP